MSADNQFVYIAAFLAVHQSTRLCSQRFLSTNLPSSPDSFWQALALLPAKFPWHSEVLPASRMLEMSLRSYSCLVPLCHGSKSDVVIQCDILQRLESVKLTTSVSGPARWSPNVHTTSPAFRWQPDRIYVFSEQLQGQLDRDCKRKSEADISVLCNRCGHGHFCSQL